MNPLSVDRDSRIVASPSDDTLDRLLAHHDWVRALAATLVHGDERADEVTQQTWLAALERPPASAANVKHWLAIVARNVARKLVRGERRRERHEAAAPAPCVAPSPAEIVARTEAHRRVVEALLELHEPTRSTLLYRYFEGLAPAEIARSTGVPVDTVKTRLKRGLAELRGRFERDAGEVGLPWQLALAPLLPAGWPELATTLPVRAAPSQPGSSTVPRPSPVTAAAVVGGVTLMSQAKLWTAAAALGIAALFGWQALDLQPASPRASRPEDSPVVSEPAAAALPTPVVAERATAEPATLPDVAAETSPSSAPVASDALVGLVRDEAGAPVAGARVFLGVQNAEGFHGPEEFLRRFLFERAGVPAAVASASTTTGDDGTFTFATASATSTWTLGVLDATKGFGFVSNVQLQQRPHRVEITLVRGTRVHGRIVAPSGEPVPRARVAVGVVMSDEALAAADSFGLASIVADDHGDYRAPLLPYRAFQITASPPDRVNAARLMETSSSVVRADGDADLRIDVTLDRVRTLHGRLLAPDGGPALLAERLLPFLTAAERERQWEQGFAIAAVNDDPRVALGLLPPQDPTRPRYIHWLRGQIDVATDTWTLDLTDRLPTFVAVICRKRVLSQAEIPRDVDEIDLVVDLSSIPPPLARGRLVVHVEREDGGPLAKIRIGGSHVWREGSSLFTQNLYGFTDADGTYEEELFAGDVVVQAELAGAISPSVPLRIGIGETVETRLLLAAVAGGLQGQVVGIDGQPLAGALVRVYRSVDDEWQPVAIAMPRTDAAGAFELPSLPDGPLAVIADAGSSAPAVAVVEEVAQPARTTAPEQRLVLRVGSGVAIHLNARTTDGSALSMVTWRLRNADGIPVIDGFHGDPDGFLHGADDQRFQIEVGDYDVECAAPGYATAHARLVAAAGAATTVTMVPESK